MKMNGMCYVYAADLNWIVIYANSYGIVILRCVKKHLIHFFYIHVLYLVYLTGVVVTIPACVYPSTLYLGSYTLPDHRPPPTVLQRLRSWVILSISPQLRPTSTMSAMWSSLQELFGLPLLPCVFYIRVCRVMLEAGFRSVCPILPHRLLFISISIGPCFVRCQRSALLMVSGRCI